MVLPQILVLPSLSLAPVVEVVEMVKESRSGLWVVPVVQVVV